MKRSEFKRLIKELRPDWATPPIKKGQRAIDKQRNRLVQWAKLGRPKPSRFADDLQWDLANCLYASCNTKGVMYDKAFDRQIHDLRPDWFEPPFVRARRLAQTIALEEAELGFPKPENLSNLIKHGGVAFEKELKKLRPEWFRSPRFDEKKLRQTKQRILTKVRAFKLVDHAERQFMYRCNQKDTYLYDPVFLKIVAKYRLPQQNPFPNRPRRYNKTGRSQ